MSTLEKICYGIAALALVLLIGTYGAVETGSVSLAVGTVRCCVFLSAACGSVYAGRRWA